MTTSSLQLSTTAGINHINGAFDPETEVFHIVYSDGTESYYNYVPFINGTIGSPGSVQSFSSDVVLPSVDAVNDLVVIIGNDTTNDSIRLFTKQHDNLTPGAITEIREFNGTDNVLITDACIADVAWIDIITNPQPQQVLITYQDNYAAFGNKGKTIKYNVDTDTVIKKNLTVLTNENSVKTIIQRSGTDLYIATTEVSVDPDSKKMYLVKYSDATNSEYLVYDGTAVGSLNLSLNDFVINTSNTFVNNTFTDMFILSAIDVTNDEFV